MKAKSTKKTKTSKANTPRHSVGVGVGVGVPDLSPASLLPRLVLGVPSSLLTPLPLPLPLPLLSCSLSDRTNRGGEDQGGQRLLPGPTLVLGSPVAGYAGSHNNQEIANRSVPPKCGEEGRRRGERTIVSGEW